MHIDAIFQALSDPTRRAILLNLIDGERNLGDLAKPHNFSLPMISKHVKVLENAGLVTKRIDKQQRFFALSQPAFAEIDKFLAKFRRAFNQNRNS